jgi:hypothetical protein
MKSAHPLATPNQDYHISEGEDSEGGFSFFPEEPLRFCNGRIVVSKAVVLSVYVVCLIIASSLNRVVFRLAQYSMVNYPYVLSQTVTLITLPVYFVVILFKLLFTDDITSKMLHFPKWKFAIMGILDGLSLLALFTSGNFIQGILQTLLIQGNFNSIDLEFLLTSSLCPSRDDFLAVLSAIPRQSCVPVGACHHGPHAHQVHGDLHRRRGHRQVPRPAAMQAARQRYNGLYFFYIFFACSQFFLFLGRDIGDIPSRLKNAVPPDDDIVAIFFKVICFISCTFLNCRKYTRS